MCWSKSRWLRHGGEADELVRLAQSLNRIGQVGHLERFNPAVRATAPLITQPMFFEVHRLSVFTPRSLDVDVILDLMIHDLDIVLWLVKSPVKEIRAVGLPILSGKADIANVRLEFESGCVANFTASRVSTERVRKLRFFQPRQYVSLGLQPPGSAGVQRGRGGRAAERLRSIPRSRSQSRRLWRKSRYRLNSGRSSSSADAFQPPGLVRRRAPRPGCGPRHCCGDSRTRTESSARTTALKTCCKTA